MEIAAHILLSVICTLLGLFLINRYVFCWVGLVLSRLPTSESPILEYKTIGVRAPNSGSKRLRFVVNLPKLNTEFASNPDYEVIYHRGHATVYDGMFTIYRKFGKVWYYVSFSTYTRRNPASALNWFPIWPQEQEHHYICGGRAKSPSKVKILLSPHTYYGEESGAWSRICR